jgi:hypothetical protein
MVIRLIEWILELILIYRVAEKNLRTAMSRQNSSQAMLKPTAAASISSP